jgi:UDP-N-acetylglucosamine 2-epimerase (non-hydrolysing)
MDPFFKTNMKVAIIIGTRPEAIKLAPLVLHMQKDPSFDVQVIDSGQHKEMSQQVYSLFNIEPQVHLDVMVPGQTLTQLSSNLHLKLGAYFAASKPDVVVVQGDTTTAMVGALEAFYHQIPVAHVEAGLRTGNIYSPFPEELNRKIIGEIARWNFAPTKKAADQLLSEGKKNVYNVGNTVVDALIQLQPTLESHAEELSKPFPFDIPQGKTVLITAHRRESFGGGLDQVFAAIYVLAEKYKDLQFVFPVHLNPSVRAAVKGSLMNVHNIKLIEPVNYSELLFLLNRSHIVLTDSGGIQEEAPSFRVPVLVLRETTERPEGVEAGCAILCGTNKTLIIDQFNRLMEDSKAYAAMTQSENPYGDGRTSERIVSILKKG